MLKLYEDMMKHEQEILDLEEEERAKGTKDLAENIREEISENRKTDTEDILEITRELDQTNLEDEKISPTSDNKRSISEQEEDLSENKKTKFEEKDNTNIKKRDRDNGEGPSGTK
uniref:hypothetical protein n=1 Tax=Myrothecium inundatum TaxID=110576 RepID=UPI001EDF68C4|nr:hypothetical protein MFQ09_mgp10 [Myrothecium inundatum]UIX25785.1 hypothetical protein [Myrothecium inundatum]